MAHLPVGQGRTRRDASGFVALCMCCLLGRGCVCVPPSPSLRLLPSAMLDDRVPPNPRPFSPPDELFASDLTHP